jgi:hypothetical protein|nr:MAG TPA: hypothetical protein [Caudoviricetes sp.]
MLEGYVLSTMIFIFAIIFSIALILVIKDNIINEKKGLNPQIAMVVGLSVLSIAILEAAGYWIIELAIMIINKIDTMSHMSKLIMYAVDIIIAIVMCIYFAMKVDEISDNNDEIDHQQSEDEETKSDVVEPTPEEHTDI